MCGRVGRVWVGGLGLLLTLGVEKVVMPDTGNRLVLDRQYKYNIVCNSLSIIYIQSIAVSQ